MTSFSNATAAWSRQQKVQRKQLAKDVTAYYAQIKERNIQKIIVDCCEKAHIPYMRNRDVKLVTRKDGKTFMTPLAKSQKGKPDLTVVCKWGKSIWIETKAPKGKLRPDQERWRADLQERDHEYYAPRTPDEAEQVCLRILAVGR